MLARHASALFRARPTASRWNEVLEAERLGYDFGVERRGLRHRRGDADRLGAGAAPTRIKAGTGIMQMPARTPACAAMTAMTLQAMSGNRFLCGIGAIGPAGRRGLARRAVRQAAGAHARIHRDPPQDPRSARRRSNMTASITRSPTRGPGATGLGKPLRSIMHGDPDIADLHRFDRAGRARGPRARWPTARCRSSCRPRSRRRSTGPIAEGDGRAPAPAGASPTSIVAPYVRISMGDDLAGLPRRGAGHSSRSISAAWAPGRGTSQRLHQAPRLRRGRR